MTKLEEYAKRLGIELPEKTTSPIDIEAGKAGYNKYLADLEVAKNEKAANEYQPKNNFEKFIINLSKAAATSGSENPTMQGLNNAIADMREDDSYMRPSDNWTDEEKWAFGEKYAQNAEDAYKFAKQLNDAKAQEEKQKQAAALAKWSSKNGVNRNLASAASLGLNAVLGGVGYLDALAQKAAGREEIAQHNVLLPHEIANTMQGSVAQHLNDKYGTLNENVPILGGKGLGDVYGLGMSIGQSALSGAMGGSVGTLVQFFGMSASQGVTDALERGATSDQALAYGTIAGLAEAIPEMISMDSLLGIASAEGMQNLLKNVLKQAGQEAGEELTTSLINEVADRWIMGGKSNYQLKVNELVASGMSLKDAQNKAFTETLESIAFDALSGALSGGISGAGAHGFNRINQQFLQQEENATAKALLSSEQNKLIEEAKKYDTTKKNATALEKKTAGGKELSGYELRSLASSVSQASRTADVEATRKAIVAQMEKEGLSKTEAKVLGEIALNKAIGNEVSKVQDLMLKRNENALKVYNQISEEMMESGLGDSEWAQNTPIQRLRAEKRANEQPDTEQRVHSGIERLKADIAAKYGKDTREYKINMASIEGKFGEVDDKIVYKPSEGSKLHVDGISSSLTQEDMIELAAIEKIANELGVDIHVYETKVDNKTGERVYTDKDGKRYSDSGFYDSSDNSIHIDLRAGQNGEGTMLYTASHEVVHFIKKNASDHFDALEKLVTKALVDGGYSVEKLIDKQKDILKQNGWDGTEANFEEVAREEMVAEACQKFLASKSAVAEIKALKTKNKGLWTTLKKFFTSLFNKINKVYKTVPPDSAEGKYIADMRKSVKPIRDAFFEGAVEASKKAKTTTIRKTSEKEVKSKARVTSEQDTAYLDAVNRGDMETAQRMVDEAAREAGYNYKGMHGTSADFNNFDYSYIGDDNKLGLGFYFTNNEELQFEYDYKKNAYLKISNPIFDNNSTLDEILRMEDDLRQKGLTQEETLKAIQAEFGYDGIVAEYNRKALVAFNPEQIKSADPITYDDNGNVIPLSERFNEKSKDIRHKSRVDKYTLKEYNSFGWARANDVLSAFENEKLRSMFADAKTNRSKLPISKAGEYMIAIGEDVDNKIVYMQGEIDNPIITRVLTIDENDETRLDELRRETYAYERGSVQRKAGGVFHVHTSNDVGYTEYEQRVSLQGERYNNQLGADRGTGSGAAQKAERGIPENLPQYAVAQKFKDISGVTRNVRRLNGQFMVEGTKRKNYLFGSIEAAINAENESLISRYAKKTEHSIPWVKSKIAADPEFLYNKIRHKSRSTVTSGQYEQMKANLSHNKVYSKKSAMELVKRIAPGIRNRSFETLSNQLWEGLNSYTNTEDRRQFAKDMSEMFIDRMLVDTLVKHSEWDAAVEKMAYLKAGIRCISFREEDIPDLKYKLDKKFPGLRSRWGYKKNSDGSFKRAYGLDEFITDLSREMPGMAYLAEMHPAEALVEVNALYTDLQEQIKGKYESAYNEFSDEEIKEIQQGIEYEIMHAYTELGDKTKIAKYLEEKFDYYQSRIDYWKAENAKTKKVTRWHNIISTKALQIKDLKKGAYYNATQHHQDIFKNSIETLANIQWRANLKPTQKISEIFENLKQWYTMHNPMLYNKDSELNVYSDTIATYITKIADSKGAFDDNTYGMVYDVMNHLYTLMRNYNKVFKDGRWQDAPSLVEDYIKVMEENKRKRNAVTRLKDTYVTEFLEPMAIAKRVDNYNEDGFFTQTMQDLRQSAINASVGEMKLRKKYDTFIDANKKYLMNAAKETVKYRGVEIPKIHLIGLYMTMKREHARAGLALNGFEFTVKNKWWDSADKVYVPGYVFDEGDVTQEMINTATMEQMKIIEKEFTATDKEYISILESLFNEDLRALKLERDMERQGYTNATLDYYYPIIRGAMAENIDTSKFSDQNRATNSSFNKNTVKGAKQRLVIISADAMVNRHITDMCKYYYMSQAIENYNVLYNCDISGNPNNPMNIAKIVSEGKIWEKDVAYFRQLVKDMQGIRDPRTAWENAFESLRGNYAKFALGLNVKVLATQFSSVIAAGNVIGFKSLATLKGFKTSTADIEKYCPIASVRSYDKTALKAMSVTDKLDKTTEAFTSMISVVDDFVIRKLFGSCQVEAQKRGLGELGTEENKFAAGKILEQVILETQQNSYATERSQAMRSRNEILKSLTMFTADGMKLVSRIHEAVGEFKVAKASGDSSKIKAARKKVARSFATSISVAVYMASVAVAFNWILAKDEDDEDKLLAFGLDVLGNTINALPLISEFYELLVNGFEVESAIFDTINNVAKGIANVTKDAHNLIFNPKNVSMEDLNRDLRTLLYGVGQMSGIPVRNVYNLGRGILDKFSSKATYYLDSKFYETSLKSDLNKALAENDSSKADYIISLLYDDRIETDVSQSQRKEVIRLTKKGYNVLPKTIPDEIKRNGRTYTLTSNQKDTIVKEYSKVTAAIDKLISSSFYSGRTDADKAYLIDYYHDKYYEIAVNKALGLVNDKVSLYNAIGFSTYAQLDYVTKGIESDKDKNGNAISGSKKEKIIAAVNKTKATEGKKLLYIASLGYKLSADDAKKLCKYLNSLSISTSSKKKIAELCGLTYKNGKIYS